MKFIAHRGNTRGKEPEKENHPDYILDAIKKGFDVEIDIWRIDDQLYLGHNSPQHIIDMKFLLENHKYLWCHAKNLEALWDLVHYGQLNSFWHQNDDYVVTTQGYIWTYPNKKIKQFADRQIVLLFEWSYIDTIIPHGGICSDYIELYKMKYGHQDS